MLNGRMLAWGVLAIGALSLSSSTIEAQDARFDPTGRWQLAYTNTGLGRTYYESGDPRTGKPFQISAYLEEADRSIGDLQVAYDEGSKTVTITGGITEEPRRFILAGARFAFAEQPLFIEQERLSPGCRVATGLGEFISFQSSNEMKYFMINFQLYRSYPGRPGPCSEINQQRLQEAASGSGSPGVLALYQNDAFDLSRIAQLSETDLVYVYEARRTG